MSNHELFWDVLKAAANLEKHGGEYGRQTTIHDAPLENDSMLDDYGHLSGWSRNTFRFRRSSSLVSLDADVAAIFHTSEEVNEALRMLIAEGRVPSKPGRG